MEIYPSQMVVRGNSDATAYCDLEWNRPSDPIVLAPDEGTMLRLRFRPEELGVSRALGEIHSNDPTRPMLPLVLCGEALAAECHQAYDGECPECPSCTQSDFEGYDTMDPVCQ